MLSLLRPGFNPWSGNWPWTSPDGQYWNQIDYILCSQWWRKTVLGADCGSDHELLIAKFRLKLKKVEKTTSPFRYELNQIFYNYSMEMTNRFKRLDLKDRVPGKLWMEVCNIVQKRLWWKTSPRKKKCKKSKWLSEEALQIAEKRREATGEGEKDRYIHLNAEFQRITRRDKAFLNDQYKEIEENNRMGKTREVFQEN